METWEERMEVTEYVEERIKKDFPNYSGLSHLCIKDLDGTEIKKDDTYYNELKAFKTIFSFGEKGKIYLWNEIIYYYRDLNQFDLNDFSKEEETFLKEMIKHHKEITEKYPKFFNENCKNVNAFFETNRLILRPFDTILQKEYTDFFDKNRSEYRKFYLIDSDDFRSYLFKGLKHEQSFAIILKETNQFIGSIGLSLLRSNCVYNLEYFILPEYRRKGFAHEALDKLIQLVKTKKLVQLEETTRLYVYNTVHPNIKCIEAEIESSNTTSINLIKKFDFEYMGLKKFTYEIQGKCIDTLIYDLVL